MKTFSFSLQRLLETKQAMEQTVEMRLAAASRDIFVAQNWLKKLNARRQKEVKRVEAFKGARTSGRALSRHQEYLENLGVREEEASESIVQYEILRDEVRADLIDVVKERKTLERLKAREKKEWVLQNRREDLKEMDEIASTRFMRHKRAV